MNIVILLLGAWSSQVAGGPLHQRDAIPGYGSPPYYPTPYGGWTSEWQESYARAWELVRQMTLAEKANITAGTGLFMGECDH
jgi:beta-glucosidase